MLMNDETMDWDIGRTGRKWTGPEGLAKLERLPGRLELVDGKLCFNDTERRRLLAGLLENIGLDEVVLLGSVEDWQQAIAARAEARPKPPATADTETQRRYWNYRVIEFPSEEEVCCAIHEVYYEHGVPVAYGKSPTDPGWTKEDGPAAGLDQLDKFKEALRKPSLKVSDFQNAGAKAALMDKLGHMIEDSGGVRDRVALSAWMDTWLAEPLLELGGATPAQALASEDGRRQVETLLERMRGGLPG
jgi:Protein of unknown function (DUF2384)